MKKHKQRLKNTLDGAIRSAIDMYNGFVVHENIAKLERIERMAYAQTLLLNGWSNDTGRN